MQFHNYYNIDLHVIDSLVDFSYKINEVYKQYDVTFCYSIYHLLFLIFSIALLILFSVSFDSKLILNKINGYFFIFICLLILLLLNNNSADFFLFDYLLIQDKFSIFIQNILIINLIICVLMSFNYIYLESIVQYEYFLLLSLSLLGILTLTQANDLITLYLAIELQSLAFYVLASFKIYSNFSTEAGLKYFILGSFSSGILLFGSSLVYGFTGTTNFTDLQLIFVDSELPINIYNGLLLGFIFITIGILFKIGVVPFHMWLPDVYEGVPTTITAIFAIVPKIALFALLFRLGTNLFPTNFFFWHQLFIYTALLSIIVGTLAALYQVKLKKLLAYSAISHVGFLLVSFAGFNSFSIFATFFYLLVYIIISINIFTVLLSLRKYDNFLKLKKINEIVLLFKSNSLMAVNIAIIMFSIAGIPPLLGFYSKFYIFVSAIKSDLYSVALFVIMLSVIASMYYIRLIKLMFFKRFNSWIFLVDISKINALIISITLVINLIFSFYPEIFLIYLYNSIFEIF